MQHNHQSNIEDPENNATAPVTATKPTAQKPSTERSAEKQVTVTEQALVQPISDVLLSSYHPRTSGVKPTPVTTPATKDTPGNDTATTA